MPTTKSIFASKTFWFNVAGVAIWVAQHFFGVQVLDPTSLAGGALAGNLALRAVTNQGVHIA